MDPAGHEYPRQTVCRARSSSRPRAQPGRNSLAADPAATAAVRHGREARAAGLPRGPGSRTGARQAPRRRTVRRQPHPARQRQPRGKRRGMPRNITSAGGIHVRLPRRRNMPGPRRGLAGSRQHVPRDAVPARHAVPLHRRRMPARQPGTGQAGQPPAPSAAEPRRRGLGPGARSLLYTPAEAAQLLKVPESWLRKKAAARVIPCTFVGKHLRFSSTDLAVIVDAGARQPRQRQAVPGRHPRAGSARRT